MPASVYFKGKVEWVNVLSCLLKTRFRTVQIFTTVTKFGCTYLIFTLDRLTIELDLLITEKVWFERNINMNCNYEQVRHNHHLGYNIPFGGQSPISVPLITDQMGVKIRATSNACIFEHGASCQVA